MNPFSSGTGNNGGFQGNRNGNRQQTGHGGGKQNQGGNNPFSNSLTVPGNNGLLNGTGFNNGSRVVQSQGGGGQQRKNQKGHGHQNGGGNNAFQHNQGNARGVSNSFQQNQGNARGVSNSFQQNQGNARGVSNSFQHNQGNARGVSNSFQQNQGNARGVSGFNNGNRNNWNNNQNSQPHNLNRSAVSGNNPFVGNNHNMHNVSYNNQPEFRGGGGNFQQNYNPSGQFQPQTTSSGGTYPSATVHQNPFNNLQQAHIQYQQVQTNFYPNQQGTYQPPITGPGNYPFTQGALAHGNMQNPMEPLPNVDSGEIKNIDFQQALRAGLENTTNDDETEHKQESENAQEEEDIASETIVTLEPGTEAKMIKQWLEKSPFNQFAEEFQGHCRSKSIIYGRIPEIMTNTKI